MLDTDIKLESAPTTLPGSLVQALREHHATRRPLVIEFAGMPRAGKDTSMHVLAESIKGLGITVDLFEESACLCPFGKEDHFSFTRWGLHRVLNKLFEVRAFAPANVVLFNRGLFDVITFLHLLRKEGEITESALELTKRYLSLTEPHHVVSCVLLLMASPAKSLERDAEGTGPYRRIMNDSTLKTLSSCYEYTRREAQWCDRIARISTDTLNPHELHNQICDALVKILFKSSKAKGERFVQIPMSDSFASR